MWVDVGIKTLELNQWLMYDQPIFGETIRLTAGNLQDYQFFKSYAIVQLTWPEGEIDNYTESKRIYPRPEPLVLDFPIPQDIKDAVGSLVRFVLVKKVIYYRWRGRSNEPAWTLKVEDYV